MAKSTVLDRVARDLSRGHTHQALQRLSSLTAAHPTDLDLRRRLAAVHLAVGDLVEAGRWQYLDENGDPGAVAAFERANPTPAQRLRALRWPGTSQQAPTGFARQRLRGLAERATPAAVTHRVRWGSAARLAGLAVCGLFGLAVAVVGAVTVAQWLL